MESTRHYINYLLSLTKNSTNEPFTIEWTPLYGTEKKISYLANKYNIKGDEYKGSKIIEAEPSFKELLDLIVPTIERYPYSWPLEGMKLDRLGYDFSTNDNGDTIEIEPVAKHEVWRALGLVAPTPGISVPYVEPEEVTGGHLSKFSLTFGKASPISLLSFSMQATLPVRLASLIYESDISGYSEPNKVDLNYLQVEQSAENITLLFGEAIFAKRITFVLSQDNAKSNTYYLNQVGEDFTYQSTNQDAALIEEGLLKLGKTITYQTNEIYTDNEIKDWSPKRRASYVEWRKRKISSLGR